jgi:2-polyprenyl-3-methyl-5-hydroxy-6-metoxy-1,4-benzoquinol methylase
MRNYGDSYFILQKFNLLRKKQVEDMAKLVKSYRGEGRLLEIGCGDGRLSGLLSNVFDVTAVDVSGSAIEKARKMIDMKSLRIMDIEKEFPEGKYDVVLALNVLEHLERPDTVIVKIRESLRKGGVFIFSVPNNYYLGKLTTMIMNWFDKTHMSTLERNEWIDLVINLGFKPLQILNGAIYKPFRLEFVKYVASTMVVIAEKSGR